MAAFPCVVLYGNSVFLAGIAAELKERTQFELLTIDGGRLDAAVIFDLAAAQPDFAISLLRDQPGLRLVGLDPALDQVLLISAHESRVGTMTDLLGVIM